MVNPTSEWTKVLIHPLGLVGYTLFLLFGLLARVKRHDERRWILRSSLLAAGIALLGGVGLAFRNVDHKAHEAVVAQPAATSFPISTQHNDHVSQTSAGASSPNIQGVQGDVTITVDQSSGDTSKTVTPQRRPKHPVKRKKQ
jgi:hypothetical protein